MRLTDLLSLLWRRKLALVFAGLVAAVLGFTIAKSLPVRYASEGLLLIEGQAQSIPELNQVAALNAPGQSRIRTEADILRSHRLAEMVVRDLRLDEERNAAQRGLAALMAVPAAWIRQGVTMVEEWRTALLGTPGPIGEADALPSERPIDPVSLAVEDLQKYLEVRTTNDSNIVLVRYFSKDPEMAARVVNTLMERYIDLDVQAKARATQQANVWLTERLEALRQDMETADERIQAFRRETGLLEISAGALGSVALNEQQARVAVARQELARAQAAMDSASRSGRGGATSEVLGSPVIQSLRDREADIVQRAATLSQRLGPRHPERLAVEAELRDLQRQIGSETSKIVTSLRRDVEAARARLADAEAALQSSTATARSGAEASVVLARLTREADAKRQVYQSFLTRVEQTRLATAQFPAARVVSPASVPFRPNGPPASVVAAFSGFVGIFLLSGLLVLRRMTHGTINSVQELVTLTGVPNAGSLPLLGRGKRNRMQSLVLSQGQSGIAETLRALRLTLQSVAGGGPSNTVLVTSADAGDGKSTVATSLARLSAADGLRVLLIEADMRRPQMSATFGNPWPGRSIEAVLSGETRFEDAIQVDEQSGLHLLMSDRSSANPQAMIESRAFAELINRARREYQMVILDSPPIMRVADASVLSRHSDSVLFAVGWERNSRQVVAEALRRLPRAMRARVATVLTRVRPGRLDPLGYYEGYARSTSPELKRLPAPGA